MGARRLTERRRGRRAKERGGDERRCTWHVEPVTTDLFAPRPPEGTVRIARRGDQVLWASDVPGFWEFRAFLTPALSRPGEGPVWAIRGDEEMPRIAKANALLQAERLEDDIEAPGPGGIPMTIGASGDWATYAETPDGELIFKGFLTDLEYREKWVRVEGGRLMERR
jgi:hypothetical protein